MLAACNASRITFIRTMIDYRDVMPVSQDSRVSRTFKYLYRNWIWRSLLPSGLGLANQTHRSVEVPGSYSFYYYYNYYIYYLIQFSGLLSVFFVYFIPLPMGRDIYIPPTRSRICVAEVVRCFGVLELLTNTYYYTEPVLNIL